MPKKQKIVPKQADLGGTIQSLTFHNFTLFNQSELRFISGVNFLTYASPVDRLLFEFIMTVSLNPFYSHQHKKTDSNISQLIEQVKQNNKKSVSFIIQLQVQPDKISDFANDMLDSFIANNEIQLQFEIDLDNTIVFRYFDVNKEKFIVCTPSVEYTISQVVQKTVFIDNSTFPYFNTDTIVEILHYNHTQLFDFILALTNLSDLKNHYYKLKEDINFKLLESENFQTIKQQAEEKRIAIEQELNIIKEIDELTVKINLLDVEKAWAHYFDLKGKFESKSDTIEQLNKKIPDLQQEKEEFEQQIAEQSQKIEELQNELETATSQYDQQRKEFLTEKASMDKMDRNLKNWDANVSKIERDLKFKSMKLKDKEKKLKDLEARIAKSSSEALVAQKEKLEKEVKKDQKEITGLQENLDAVKNEKSLKSKERTVKEKKSQPKSEILADLTSKMDKLSESIRSKEEQLTGLKEKLTTIETTIEKNQQEKNSLENEVTTLSTNLTSEMDDLRKRSIEMPKESRSLSTINILQSQLTNQQTNLTSKIHKDTSEKAYKDHLAFIENLETEFNEREKQLGQLDTLLKQWENEWKSVFETNVEQIQTAMQSFLDIFNLQIHVTLSKHTNPNEGSIAIHYAVQDDSTKTLVPINNVTGNSIISLLCLVLSTMILHNSSLYVFDIFDFLTLSNEKFKELMVSVQSKITELPTNTKENSSQAIFLVQNNLIENLPELKQYVIIK